MSEENYRDIPYPRTELTIHVTTKTTQAGVILGSAVIAPIVSIVKRNNFRAISDRSYKYAKNGFLVGLVLGPILTAARCYNLQIDSIHDRCYRIRHNQNQMRADRLSFLGGAVSAGLSGFAGIGLVKGALYGYGAGCVTAGAISFALESNKKST